MYEELNGASTLSLTSYNHVDNPGHNLITQEGFIEYDGYKFRIKQLRKQTNSIQVSCISTYYDNVDKYKYDIYGGTHTLSEFMTYVLSGTGWTWVAEGIDAGRSELIPNFGQNNVIRLMDALKVIFGFELRIDRNNQVTVSNKLGPDNDSQYRYGYNIAALTESIDTTKLKTYIEGFGANGLRVTYTSPYSANPGIGIRHAEPIYDDGYTDSDSLLKYIKTQLIDHPESVIELDDAVLMGKAIGERVWVIHERMGIEYQTRVVAKRIKIPNSLSSVTLGTYMPQSRSIGNTLATQRVDIDRNNSITRSRIDQTNEKILLEVTRLDGVDSWTQSSITVQADRITQEVSDRQNGDSNSTSLIEQTATSIRSEVSTETTRLDGRVDSANSLISQQAGEILLRVRKDGVISSINQTAEVVRITASKIDLQGAVTISDLNPTVSSKITKLDSNGIYTGTLTADKVISGILSGVTINVGTNATIGNKLILSSTDFDSGIQWGTGSNPSYMYVDPGGKRMSFNSSGGIYANGFRIDTAPTAKFG